MNSRETVIESPFIFEIESTNDFTCYWLFLYDPVQSRFKKNFKKIMNRDNLFKKFTSWYYPVYTYMGLMRKQTKEY